MAETATHTREFIKRFKEVAGDGDSIQALLDEALMLQGRVRVYGTRDANPSKQIKNKLSQGTPQSIGGLIVIRLASEEATASALTAFRDNWAANSEWPKGAACILIGYPLDAQFEPRFAIQWHTAAFVDQLRDYWPALEVVDAKDSPAEFAASRNAAVLPPGPPPNIWIELYTGDHEHGGPGWELGIRLWSPTRNKTGADRYAPMREVKPGDLVLHVSKGQLGSFSTAASACIESDELPPTPGSYSDAEKVYYIDLKDHRPLVQPIDLKEFRQTYRHELQAEIETEKIKYYPFNLYRDEIRTVQGFYLTRCTRRLYDLLLKATTTTPLLDLEGRLDDVFIDKFEFTTVVEEFRRKKNLILQGPPGVGKTFVARTLAYALIGSEEPHRVRMTQFHQSYSYEDFIQGWRPHEAGGFRRKNGTFLDFCEQAADDRSGRPWVFIIDEINRGNLSKIFGELLMLIERDKRHPDFAVPLTYADPERGDEPFYVPENVFMLGLMNTADRSLAVVDYALRRRFSFVSLAPQFEHPKFKKHIMRRGLPESVADALVVRVARLNEQIRSDRRLGDGFLIGHSFFCDSPPDAHETWYRTVVQNEIAPLLREYWFDDPDQVELALKRLAM